MRHLIFRGSFPKKIVTIASAAAFVCVPGALSQRGGARVGGGAHFPSAPHVSRPPMSVPRAPTAPRPAPMPPPPRPVAPPHPVQISPPPRPAVPRALPMPATPRRLGQPPAAGFGTPGFRPQLIPPKRLPIPRPTIVKPVAPIFSYPVIIGQPPLFFGLGTGLNGWNALWWQGCGPFSLWYWGCNTTPFYGFGYGDYLSGSSTYEPRPYELPAYQPLYLYSGQPRELVELYLKDGTVYDVTDYWVVNDQLHFTTTENGKSEEHTIPFSDLDLQKTIDVNTQRGFHFTLRNEPIEQYIKDHPEIGSPNSTVPSLSSPEAPGSPEVPAAPPQDQSSPTTVQPEAPNTPQQAAPAPNPTSATPHP